LVHHSKMNLREFCRERILTDMIRSINPATGAGWKALIVDQESMRILSACCRMYDIMEENVTVVEKIDIARQPLPSLEAIYFITPKSESVDFLINDFRKKDKPTYACAHIFFTSKLPDSEFQKISGSNASSRIKTLKEFNMEFLAYESQVFHMDMNDGLVQFFSANGDPISTKELVASRLVTMMATLNEYPIIRYAQSQRLAQALAQSTQQRLDALARSAVGWNPNEERATLLILDRTLDPLAPLLHEFTYQAMIYDVLDVENDKYIYTFQTNSGVPGKKEVILGENDVLWPVLRHMHIADTIEWVIESFNDFCKNNKATKLTGGKQVESLKDMSEAMRAMPQYTEMLAKYSLHINMANTAMEVFNTRGLERIAQIEQDMATGEDAERHTVKNVISRLPPILSDPGVSREDKLRLLIIYIISQEGIKDSDRKRLMDLAGVSIADQATISNISNLGVTLNKGAKGKNKGKKKDTRKKRRDDVPYELSRFAPTLSSILEDLAQDKLDATEFPFVREDPTFSSGKGASSSKNEKVSLKGAGSKQPRWADKGKKKDDGKPSFQGPRLIVFIAGGMTYSEMRTAYEISQAHQRVVFVGSTHAMTPKKFLDDLAHLRAAP